MWFDSFSSCVIILVANEYHEIAMLKQNYMSEKYWTYVSGFMKPGETAEETAIREVNEAEWVQAKLAPKRMFPEKPGNTQYPLYRKYLQMIEKE